MKTARKVLSVVFAISLVFCASVAARADWNPGGPAKWVQMPDLSTNGMDVNATVSPLAPPEGLWMLADDFECTSIGPITGIHIWGSWYDDTLPQPELGPNYYPRDVVFTLSIWSDIPAVPGQMHSMPGESLWEHEFDAGEFTARHWATTIEGEGWYHPNSANPYEFPGDFQIWQYNFSVDPKDAFTQRGSDEEAEVYWLGVSASPLHQDVQETMFGWKTSIDHWNDDAVWMDDPGDNPPWRELKYPEGHNYYGQFMDLDLAFVITPEPATLGVLILGLVPVLLRRSWWRFR